MSKHYIAMAGLVGYLPNYCAVFESIEDAAENLQDVHDEAEILEELIEDQYSELNPNRDGNEYCEIVECECEDSSRHDE